MKVLVFATDVLPMPGFPTSGTALRTFGLAQGLRAHGHQVEVSVPRAALDGMRRPRDGQPLGPEVRAQVARLEATAFDFRNQASLVQEFKPDVVLCGHWPAATFQTRLSPPLVIDLAGPHLLERHYQGEPDHAGAVLGKLRALSNADYFIVSGAKQRLYFLSFLLRAGVERPEKRIITIPMPLDPQLPPRPPGTTPPDGYPRIVFAGVFLPWQDPSLALARTADTLASRGRGRLKLIGGPHPNYEIRHGVYTELFSKLSALPFVRTLPMLPYDRFLDELLEADVALDLMRWNLERELAMTIRSTTYLWSGLPVIYNDYADLAAEIQKHDAGWTVSPSDPEALRRVLDEVFDDPGAVARKGQNARRLAREIFSWDRAVAPLLAALDRDHRGSMREVDASLHYPENASLEVLTDRAVEQRFLSRIDGLCRVECLLAAHGRRHLQAITMSVYRVVGAGVDPGRQRELIAQKRVPGASIRDNDWVSVEFDPVPGSAGQTFALAIESGTSKKEESVSPWAFSARPFPLLDLSYGGRRLPQMSLCLRTSSDRGLR